MDQAISNKPQKGMTLMVRLTPDLLEGLNAAVKITDSDKSKFVRNSVRRAIKQALRSARAPQPASVNSP